MTPAKLLPLLLIFVSLLAASCGPPSENASRESSQDRPRERSSATSPPPETTMEETTSAPESIVERTVKERTVKEKAVEEKPNPKRDPAEKVVEVEIRGLEYVPSPITVAPGTTVRWINEDRALHTVTSEGAGGPLDSEELGRGESYEHTFREAGQYNYYCVVHPFMKSGVTVG